MEFIFFVCCALVAFAEGYKSSLFKPCKRCDDGCIKVSAQQAYQKLVHGIPSLGIQSSEPIYQAEISGHVHKFNYNFTDNAISGFSNCHINDINVDVYDNFFKLEFVCHNMTLIGKYNVNGEYFDTKVNENGHYKMYCPKYKIGLNTKIQKIKSSNGDTHIILLKDSTMTTYSQAEKKITTHLENCNDSKELESLFNSNWRQVSEQLQCQFVDANLKRLVTSANKFLESVCLDDLFQR